MKYYSSTTEYNCGIDLDAHQMYVCVIPIPNRDCNVQNNDFELG